MLYLSKEGCLWLLDASAPERAFSTLRLKSQIGVYKAVGSVL